MLGPVTPEALAKLVPSDNFRAFLGGKPDKVLSMLQKTASAPDAGVALAVENGHIIVGYLCAQPPPAKDRLCCASSVIGITATEVASPYRRQGLLRSLFEAAFRPSAEERIVYAIADPALRDPGESKRAYRDRIEKVFGSLGFFPYPTDHPAVMKRRNAVFLVRIGRSVPSWEVQDFVERLRGRRKPATVGIVLGDRDLRNLIRADLEHQGFEVVAVAANPGPLDPVDIVVTEFTGLRGKLATAVVVDGQEEERIDDIVYVPLDRLDCLAGILQRELVHAMESEWQK